MKTVRNLLVFAIVAGVPASAFANGLLYKLPTDGAQAVYDVTMNVKQANVVANGTITMKSVGKAKSGGKDCRWIEFTMDIAARGQQQKITAKILVPEEDLGKGKNPFTNPQKGWVSRQGVAAVEITDFNSSKAGPLPAFLAGPLVGAKKLEAKEIETGLGKLKCAGATGTHSYAQAGKDTEITYTTRLSEKSPFGVAHTVMTIKESRDGQLREVAELTLKLKSVGKDAKSGLPENK